jgi:6-phosphogluconate dehydrogenase
MITKRKEHQVMEIGLIGLGRMGANMGIRWMKAGHQCVVHARHAESVQKLLDKGATGSTDLKAFVKMLSKPRVIWLMLPAGAVDRVLTDLRPLLNAGDILVEGGNSYYHDDIRRARELQPAGIHYVDAGVSGGVWGLERGYCLMIGGEDEVVERLDPFFSALAPGIDAAPRTPKRKGPATPAEKGYFHCGPHGAGHFVKMVHNGIEYGMMAAISEGLNILHKADAGKERQDLDAETTPVRHPEFYQYRFDLHDIAEVWRRGSVVGSWLLDLTATALMEDPNLSKFKGRVSDSGEGRWTVLAAVDEGIPAPVISAALFARFSSRGHDEFADKVMSAMRYEFGGHHEKTGEESS